MSDRIVHLVDDDEAIRRSAGFMLKTSGFQVKAYASGVELLKEARELAPGCILLDVRMPEMDGLQVQAALKERGIGFPVIVMTGHGDVGVAVQAMKAGAVDFIEKPFEKAVMLSAIEEGFARIEQAGRGRARADEAQTRLQALTPREREVALLVADGHTNAQIALQLHLSERTVEKHVSRLLGKLGLASRTGVVRLIAAERREPAR